MVETVRGARSWVVLKSDHAMSIVGQSLGQINLQQADRGKHWLKIDQLALL